MLRRRREHGTYLGPVENFLNQPGFTTICVAGWWINVWSRHKGTPDVGTNYAFPVPENVVRGWHARDWRTCATVHSVPMSFQGSASCDASTATGAGSVDHSPDRHTELRANGVIEHHAGVASSNPRFFHFSPRCGDVIPAHLTVHGLLHGRIQRAPARFEERMVPGGATTCACMMHECHPDLAIGLVVAANSGRPGGSCGLRGRVGDIHPYYRTQEEDVVSSWMVAEAGECEFARDLLFNETINQKWGMQDLNSRDHWTYQNVNYVATTNPHDYADAWVVRGASVCAKCVVPEMKFDVSRRAPCSLIFVSGPNARRRYGHCHGSMARTRNQLAMQPTQEGYRFFRTAVKHALRSALDCMISEGITIALMAQVSGGCYAGPHQPRIQRDYAKLMGELLSEPVVEGCDATRAQYFKFVILPRLVSYQHPARSAGLHEVTHRDSTVRD